MNRLHTVISQALQALDVLAAALDEDIETIATLGADEKTDLARLLESLVLKRIETTRSFYVLLRLDQQKCQQLLLRRYLGSNVSPDGKFGGYESELTVLLGDLVEIQSAEALRALLLHEDFDWTKLDDARVERAFIEALSLDTRKELEEWVSNVRRPQSGD